MFFNKQSISIKPRTKQSRNISKENCETINDERANGTKRAKTQKQHQNKIIGSTWRSTNFDEKYLRKALREDSRYHRQSQFARSLVLAFDAFGWKSSGLLESAKSFFK